MYGYIYKTTNLVTGLIYIGQKHSQTFLGNKYLGSGKLIRLAIEKYGESNFSVELLEEINTKEDMDVREIYWISYYNSTDHAIGYNISEGGNVNRTMVGENNPFYGKKHSKETLEKIISANVGKIPWNKGLTKETDSRVKQYAENNTHHGEYAKNSIWINDGNNSKMVHQEQLDLFLKNSWSLGRIVSDEWKEAVSKVSLGRIRINNGEIEKNITSEELDHYLAEGWVRGRKKFKSTVNYGKNKGKVWINNGMVQTYVLKDNLQKYLDDGWKRGKLKHDEILVK